MESLALAKQRFSELKEENNSAVLPCLLSHRLSGSYLSDDRRESKAGRFFFSKTV